MVSYTPDLTYLSSARDRLPLPFDLACDVDLLQVEPFVDRMHVRRAGQLDEAAEPEGVAQAVRQIERQDQRFALLPRDTQRGGRRHRRLAHAALAGNQDDAGHAAPKLMES
jgi:hypothetical protein